MSFVEIPPATLFAFFEERGFTKRPLTRAGGEVVLERRHHRDPKYVVLIYTSVQTGRAKAASKGKDAIRVCAIRERTNAAGEPLDAKGICKLPRVHRTGTVDGTLERVLQRAREAYGACNKMVHEDWKRATDARSGATLSGCQPSQA